MTSTSKLAALALAAVVALGAAAPVLADESRNFNAPFLLTQLHYEGVNAISATQVTDSTFRATIQLADGGVTTQLFDIDSQRAIK